MLSFHIFPQIYKMFYEFTNNLNLFALLFRNLFFSPDGQVHRLHNFLFFINNNDLCFLLIYKINRVIWKKYLTKISTHENIRFRMRFWLNSPLVYKFST